LNSEGKKRIRIARGVDVGALPMSRTGGKEKRSTAWKPPIFKEKKGGGRIRSPLSKREANTRGKILRRPKKTLFFCNRDGKTSFRMLSRSRREEEWGNERRSKTSSAQNAHGKALLRRRERMTRR